MNETVTPPPPPGAPAPKKKGLSPLAWFAIGCGALIVLGLGSCFVMTAVVANKAKKFVEDVEKNPDAAAVKAAEMAMRLNPDVDVVESDPEGGTLTVRDKRSGKEVTFNIEDIKAGRLSISSGDDEVNVDFDATDHGTASMKIESKDGTMVFGGGDGSKVPGWVPVYPGARTDSFSNVEANGERSGSFAIRTSDSTETVLEFYIAKLEAAGFTVDRSTYETNGAMAGSISGRAEGRTVGVTVATQEGETQGLVTYGEKP
ncbi:MAG: hypothetical protein H6511_02590 [Holophagales bacterium]|nr:hypothetical protein [Holophagales bacterium]